ncbi:hypothetical protein M8J76_010416 [Diaphorina citri]|nr:hypothetical protein M8J76_010416 [Diaphorina citri]
MFRNPSSRSHLCNTSVSNIKEDHQKTDNIMDPRRAFGEHSLECFYPVHTSQFRYMEGARVNMFTLHYVCVDPALR